MQEHEWAKEKHADRIDPACSDRFLAAERRVPVPTSCYPAEVIFRTCYAFTDRAYLWLEPGVEGEIVVSITRKSVETDLDAVIGEFANALIDYGLRRQIGQETHGVRDAIIGAALAEAT